MCRDEKKAVLRLLSAHAKKGQKPGYCAHYQHCGGQGGESHGGLCLVSLRSEKKEERRMESKAIGAYSIQSVASALY